MALPSKICPRARWLLLTIVVAFRLTRCLAAEEITLRPGMIDRTFTPGSVPGSLVDQNQQPSRVISHPDGGVLSFALRQRSPTQRQSSTQIHHIGTDAPLRHYAEQPIPFSITSGAFLEDGTLVVGGRPSPMLAPYLARVSPEGVVSTNFGISYPGFVDDVAVQRDGKIIAAGRFEFPEGDVLAIRLNRNGTLDFSFHLTKVGFDPAKSGRRLAVQPDGRIILAFSGAVEQSGITLSNLVRLQPDGAIDTGYLIGSSLVLGRESYATGVDALLAAADGKLYIGGRFDHVGGQRKPAVARLNADGTVDQSFHHEPVVPQNSATNVTELVILPNGHLLMVGSFIAEADEQGTYVGRAPFGSAYSAAAVPDGIVLSDFYAPSGPTREFFHLVKATTAGKIDPAFNPTGPGTIIGLHRLNSKIVAVGENFQHPDGRRFGGMLLEPDGKPASYLPLPNYIVSSTIQNGKLVAAGRFPNGIYRLGENWGLDSTFKRPVFEQFAYGPVHINAQHNGAILMFGGITAQPASSWIHLLNPDGTRDNQWSSPVRTGSTSASLPDGGWIVGGMHLLGPGPHALLRIRADGSSVPFATIGLEKIAQYPPYTSYEPADVSAIETDGSTSILIAGNFSVVHEVDSRQWLPRSLVAKFNMEGVLDRNFVPVGPAYSSPPGATAVLSQPEGKVLVAGPLPDFPNCVFRYDRTGAIDGSFQTVVLDAPARVFLREPNGDILVVGGFSTVNGLDFPGLVRIVGDRVTPTVTLKTRAAGDFAMQFLITANVWGTLRIERSLDLKTWEEINLVPGFTGSFNWQTSHPSTGAGFFRASVSP